MPRREPSDTPEPDLLANNKTGNRSLVEESITRLPRFLIWSASETFHKAESRESSVAPGSCLYSLMKRHCLLC